MVEHGCLDVSRSDIEEAIASIPTPSMGEIVSLQNALIPIRCEAPEPVHRFAPGMYMRELTIPAGRVLTGKIHKHDHFMMVMSGLAIIFSEHGNAVVSGGYIAMSKAGAKRVVVTLEDTRFVTIHHNPSDTQDMGTVESEHIEAEEAIVALANREASCLGGE